MNIPDEKEPKTEHQEAPSSPMSVLEVSSTGSADVRDVDNNSADVRDVVST